MLTDKVFEAFRPERRAGGLLLRILAVNLLAPLVLVAGLLYMGQYRDNLIRAELETLRAQAQLFAGAIAEGAIRPVETGKPFLFARPVEIEILVPELSRRMVRRLGEATGNRTRLFNHRGELIGDSDLLIMPGKKLHTHPMGPPHRVEASPLARVVLWASRHVDRVIPRRDDGLKPYPYTTSLLIDAYPDARAAGGGGHVSASAWRLENGDTILTAAAPVQKISQVVGVVMLTRDGSAIEKAMIQVRFEVLTAFIGALSITIFVSLYIAGIIGRPLKKLARAAEDVRRSKGRTVQIPDLTYRRDEIGELSRSLRDMTQALWDRMDTIERFAADVAHEIKNPLTSLRSAVETAAVVKNQKDKDRLMEIVQHDVQRLDRLISDISRASRLDAELSRDEVAIVDLEALLRNIVEAHKKPLERGNLKASFGNRRDGKEAGGTVDRIRLDGAAQGPFLVRGNESRLAQVFENLVANALSFSPPGGVVTLKIDGDKNAVRVMVEDQGPGIPENKLETIFERFYSERPKHEDFGDHSGLGLSIARQIVTALNGKITASNIRNDQNMMTGARFTVILNRA